MSDSNHGMFAVKEKVSQAVLGILAKPLARSRKFQFYSKLDQTLESFEFAGKVRALFAPAYDQSGEGQPGIDPVVYLKMLMVGFFENQPSERAIAETCADSLAVRVFLGFGLDEKTPEHSSLSRIRQRVGLETHDQVFVLILSALQAHGLVKGKHVGVDSSVMEANASLRGLVNRNTEEAYWDYVKRLASEQGIDPKDGDAVRRFDRKRPKRMSNEEWVNPHDPDAKVGPKKDGATDMIYKPEVVGDLETGALVDAQVLLGDQPDYQDVSTRLLEAQQTLNAARGEPLDQLTMETATTDKGYYAVPEMQALQREEIQTVMRDPVVNRRVDKLDAAAQQTVKAAQRSTRSPLGRKLLRRRGMHLERPFAHILDSGGMRRTTLRGWLNNNKRFKLTGAFYNLSQLMRHRFGIGTPKQWEAMMPACALN
jgi:transposase